MNILIKLLRASQVSSLNSRKVRMLATTSEIIMCIAARPVFFWKTGNRSTQPKDLFASSDNTSASITPGRSSFKATPQTDTAANNGNASHKNSSANRSIGRDSNNSNQGETKRVSAIHCELLSSLFSAKTQFDSFSNSQPLFTICHVSNEICKDVTIGS